MILFYHISTHVLSAWVSKQYDIFEFLDLKKNTGNVSFDLPGPIASQVAPGPRKLASEYKPPTSFVQQMERPQSDKANSVLNDLWMFS